MKKISIYTDGACSKNPGPGGWAAVLLFADQRKELSGFVPETTNNKMELLAAINALESLKEPCEVELYSDSSYMCDGFNKNWIKAWQKNGWVTSTKNPVANRDLWERLIAQHSTHSLTFIKVKGHASNVENNRCDKLATDEIKNNV